MQVSLFISCLNDMFFPEAGEAVVRLLRRHGVTVDFPEGQTCCGQLAWNSGHHGEARALARHFLSTFGRSQYVITPSGSCAAMVRYYYFKDDRELYRQAVEIGERVYEFSRFMVNILREPDVGARFQARAVYHSSCHMTRELVVTSRNPHRKCTRRIIGHGFHRFRGLGNVEL